MDFFPRWPMHAAPARARVSAVYYFTTGCFSSCLTADEWSGWHLFFLEDTNCIVLTGYQTNGSCSLKDESYEASHFRILTALAKEIVLPTSIDPRNFVNARPSISVIHPLGATSKTQPDHYSSARYRTPFRSTNSSKRKARCELRTVHLLKMAER